MTEIKQAYLSGDESSILHEADIVLRENFDANRNENSPGQPCHTSFLPQFLPEKWVAKNYPPGYFGLERFPHWINPRRSNPPAKEFRMKKKSTVVG